MRGVGVAVGPHGAGSVGFDGLMTIRPDGMLYVQSGVGNLGTHSVIDLARVAADVLAMPWEKVEVVWGDTSKGPAVVVPVGGQPDHARDDPRQPSRREDSKRKLQALAAQRSRRTPDDYTLSGERVLPRG